MCHIARLLVSLRRVLAAKSRGNCGQISRKLHLLCIVARTISIPPHKSAPTPNKIAMGANKVASSLLVKECLSPCLSQPLVVSPYMAPCLSINPCGSHHFPPAPASSSTVSSKSHVHKTLCVSFTKTYKSTCRFRFSDFLIFCHRFCLPRALGRDSEKKRTDLLFAWSTQREDSTRLRACHD